MKFRGFMFMNDWSWIVIFPTIALFRNEPVYRDRNFTLCLHWLGWHCRWRWIEEENNDLR